MYKAGELMQKTRFIAMAMKREIQTSSAPKHRNVGVYQFLWWCPRKRVCLYCVDGTSAKQNNQIARDMIRFLLSLTEDGQKT